jgi:hypothetical protein
MLEKDNVWAKQLPRRESEVRSRKGSFVVPKLYAFIGRQGTTCIAKKNELKARPKRYKGFIYPKQEESLG